MDIFEYSFIFLCYGNHRDLHVLTHSFPTRRSSDLRSQLIDRAVDNLTGKLVEEFIVVALVCALFLWHARSALVAILTLPLGVLAALIVMRLQGLNANIMSLGGIAIAVGAMVDAAIVMIENAHKRIERWTHEHPDESRS